MKVRMSCHVFVSAAFVMVFCAGPLLTWAAPAATTTTLAMTSGGNSVVSGGSVASSSEVTLTATVAAGSTKLTIGQVDFCDAAATHCTDIHLLGTSQLTSAGIAVLRLHPGIGNHSYKAVFAGTPHGMLSTAVSPSSTVTLNVTGTFPTTSGVVATGSAGNYSLTATVTGRINTPNLPAPAGSISFLDTTNNLSLGSAPLNAGTTVSFLNSSNPAPGHDPLGLAVGDFNEDGIPDLVVTTASAETVAILLGNGDGTFSAAGLIPIAGPDAQQVVIGDFNGDGKADLALLFADINQVQILLGNGDGTFTALPPIAAPDAAGYLFATAVFNGDGKADLVLANYLTDTLTILLGNGDGTFTASAAAPAINGFPQSIAVGDFNGDGILDLAVAINSGQTSVPGSVAILLGNGDGTFTPKAQSLVTGDSPSSIVVGDFNGDGVLDLAVANGYDNTSNPGTITVLLGNGDGTFTPTAVSPVTGFIPNSITIGDFNGDGITDLAAANEGGTATILLGNGDGTFASPLSTAAGRNPCFLAAGDFNGDGLADLAVSDCYTAKGSVSTISVLLSQLARTATATAKGVSPTGTGTHQIVASYSGNDLFASTASPSTGLAAVTTPSFAITSTAVSIVSGAATGNSSTITVTPVGGFTGTVTLTAVITTSPTGAQYLPTLSFGSSSPVNVTGTNAGTATLTISTAAATSSALIYPKHPGVPWYATGGTVLACILLYGIPKRQRSWRSILGILALLIPLACGMTGCSSETGGGVSSTSGTTTGVYIVTITATSGTITQTGTVSLSVR